MDEWDVPLEETGEFDHQNEEGTSSADAGWKDELNLAEFPIAALTDRIPDGQTTMVFEDRMERRDSAPIVRRLTIMGTHKHGLPTSLDDEVLVGPDPVDQAAEQLHRPAGAVLALRADRAPGLAAERAELPADRGGVAPLGRRGADVRERLVGQRGQELGRRAVPRAGQRDALRPGAVADLGAVGAVGQGGPGRSKADKPPLPLSSFRWNEVIFQSFQSGNLKQLDLEFYLKLRLPTTKRMYRFLDKRFYRRSRLDFDLRSLACEHIGLSRSYAPTELKRRLKPALEELEQLGFLEPLGPEERYSYVKRGCWRIIFIRGGQATAEAQDPAAREEQRPGELIEALKARGVTARTAQELVEAHPAGRVRTKIEVFDWLLRNEDRRVGKNPAGYLVASIRSDYQAPVDYQAQADRRPRRRARPRRRPRPRRSRSRPRPRRGRARQGPRGAAPRRLGAAARGRARGHPRRRQGREPRHRAAGRTCSSPSAWPRWRPG